MPRVAPQPTVEHRAAVGGLGPEALELIVAHDLEAESDREQHDSQAIDGGEGGGLRGAHRDEERKGDEPQDRALQPEDGEQAPPPEGRSMRGAHRLVAWILAFAMIAAKDVQGETRAPQRDQRRDQPGPWCQRRRQQAVQPRQQHEAEAPADVRDTRIPKPHAEHPHEGQGRQDGAKTDERRHDAGHDRAFADRSQRSLAAAPAPPIARSIPPNITACTGRSTYQ